MPSSQDYIDALRNQDYFKVLELANFVVDKYKVKKSNNGADEVVGADELIPLMIYELCQTDINDEEIAKINFLFSYINYHDSLSRGHYGYEVVTLAMPLSMALAAKKMPDFQEVMNNTHINDSQQYKAFLKDDSPFSQLMGRVNSRDENAAITAPLSERAMASQIAAMSPENFTLFQEKIAYIREHEEIEIECPFIQAVNQAVNQTVELRNILNALLTHLSDKLDAQGVTDPELEELNVKQEKLIKRYTAIYELNEYFQNRIAYEPDDLTKLRDALNLCKENEPTWSERSFLDKISDIFSLGLKPLYRGFFSKESSHIKAIDEVVNTLAAPAA